VTKNDYHKIGTTSYSSLPIIPVVLGTPCEMALVEFSGVCTIY
jgi:hypothetical protein